MLLEKITFDYSMQEDRICVMAQTRQGDPVRMWLTHRLCKSLASTLLEHLDKTTPIPPAADKDMMMAFKQSAAMLQQAPSAPVQTPDHTLSVRIDVVDIHMAADKVDRRKERRGALRQRRVGGGERVLQLADLCGRLETGNERPRRLCCTHEVGVRINQARNHRAAAKIDHPVRGRQQDKAPAAAVEDPARCPDTFHDRADSQPAERGARDALTQRARARVVLRAGRSRERRHEHLLVVGSGDRGRGLQCH